MSLAKKATELDYEGIEMPYLSDESYIDDYLMVEDEDPELLVLDEEDELDLAHGNMDLGLMPEQSPMMVFELPMVPGGENQDEIEDDVEVEEEDDIELDSDPWRWSVSDFCSWLQDKVQNVPRHSGRDSAGLERAIAYLERVDKEISRAVRMDLNNEIDINAVEKARDEIHKGRERLVDRLDKIISKKYPKRKKKKKSEMTPDMVKEASKGAYYGAVTVTIPILISGIARACINSMVSAGKDIEDEFQKLATQYGLDKREEFMLYQTLSDMGYHVRRPRGTELDEEVNRSSTENTGWIADYPG